MEDWSFFGGKKNRIKEKEKNLVMALPQAFITCPVLFTFTGLWSGLQRRPVMDSMQRRPKRLHLCAFFNLQNRVDLHLIGCHTFFEV